MRSADYRPYLSVTVILLIINAAVFLLQAVNQFYLRLPYEDYFTLSKEGLLRGYVWQLITFQFMHSGPMHLLCNSIGLYFLGRAVEESLGRGHFLALYLLSGICGGLLQVLGQIVVPANFGAQVVVPGALGWNGVVGASAGVFGLLAAYATLYPEQLLTFLAWCIIPISVRAKYLLYFGLGTSIFGILFPFSNLAHGAHLGGMLTAIAYVHWGVKNDWRWFNWRALRPRVRPRELVRASTFRQAGWRTQKPAEPMDLPPDEFISREVDPILDKISAHGLHSLTQRERAILEAARRKMTRR